MTTTTTHIHDTAEVADSASIGEGTKVWHHAQVREGARIGRDCILGKGVYVDKDVVVGDRCKIQNRASVFHGVTLADGVFVGPHAVFANDTFPRAINPDGSLKSEDDWTAEPTRVGHGASIGAGAVVLPGVTIGDWALVAAGAVVTADVPAHGIVKGNPARMAGWACTCGRPLRMERVDDYHCDACGRTFEAASMHE
jgi:acetyltransferase-like isoleucine patch superfamily enzyme